MRPSFHVSRPGLLVSGILFGALTTLAWAKDGPAIEKLQVPSGFHVAVYAADVPNARALAIGSKGTVFVGSRSAGKVYALSDEDQNGRADKVRVIAEGLNMPAGVAFHEGDLYISAVSQILVLRTSRISNNSGKVSNAIYPFDCSPNVCLGTDITFDELEIRVIEKVNDRFSTIH